MGVISDNLRLSEKGGAPYLLYESGSACDLNRKWTTKIEFICQTDKLTAGPQIIEDTNCTIIIQFVTKAVCQKDVCRLQFFSPRNSKIKLIHVFILCRLNAVLMTFMRIVKLI